MCQPSVPLAWIAATVVGDGSGDAVAGRGRVGLGAAVGVTIGVGVAVDVQAATTSMPMTIAAADDAWDERISCPSGRSTGETLGLARCSRSPVRPAFPGA
jgi:hypothetical protein